MDVVGCAAHQAIANEIAERSLTLIRNDDGLLPLKINPEQRIAIIIPKPVDLTPADTSSYITPNLAAAMREHHPDIDEYIISYTPGTQEISEVIGSLKDYDILVLGTLNAFTSPNQAVFVRRVLELNIPTVVTALRLPYDLMSFPEVQTYVCTYSILEPAMRALAKALFGKTSFEGRLPVSIPSLYEAGFSARA